MLLGVSLTFLLIPFFISLVSLLRTITCPLVDGILFYIFLTLPAPIIGIGLGVLSFSFSKRFSLLLFLLSLVVVSFIPVFEIYCNPQIYFYNPIIGFFPGTIYDEAIDVDLKLIIYRMLNVLYFGSVVFFVFRTLGSSSKHLLRITWLVLLLLPIAFIILSPHFGYSITMFRVKDELNKSITSEHYEIHYSSALNDSLIKVIALHHEFYYSELEKYFKEKPREKIISLIFSSREQKKRLFGSANADVAKPWIPEIYITAESYDKTLKHEIAHCFAGVFGSNIFKVADYFNPSLIEGIAMAADPAYDDVDLDYVAALAFTHGFKINVSALFKSFNFFVHPSSLGYIVAGSFIKFLNDKYGIDPFKKLYTDMDFPKHYGQELPELVNEFETHLSNRFMPPPETNDRAKYYYGRKSIFYKVCPRYLAKRLNEAWRLYYQKNITEAKIIFEELLSNNDTYSPLIGLTFCLKELKQNQQAIDLLKANIKKFENTAYYYEIEFLLADLLAGNYQIAEADSLYKVILVQNPNRVLLSLSTLRTELINADSIIIDYLGSGDEEKYKILKQINSSQNNYAVFPYLASLSKAGDEDYEDFLKNFSNPFEVNSYLSSYAAYKMSTYMCEKMDFERGRKMAALSIRYSGDFSFNSVLQSNFSKLDWLYKNKDMISDFIISNN